MKPERINKRRACVTPSHTKRSKYDNIEIEATDKSIPGDLDFYIDDEGNYERLEIGSAPTVADSPVRLASPLAQPNRDQYCWVCHKDETAKFCETCLRSFHIKCLRRSPNGKQSTDSPENWQCPQCKELRTAKNDFKRRQVDLVKFNELLKFIVVRLYSDEDLQKFGTVFNNVLRSVPDITIINPIDLNLIDEKVTDSKYESIMEFIVDIKWIFHNCGIAFKGNKSIFQQARRMLRFCERELYDIEICPECYLRSNTDTKNNWFVNACERPHLLVWAKLKGNHEPYWPAKALAWKNGMVDVRFFGDHACAFLPSAHIFLYSKENLNKRLSVQNQKLFDSYAKEVGKYITNLDDKFGMFKLMPPMTKFQPEKIYIHLHQMLPYLYIEEKFEYFRKMKDFTKREAKQPEKLSLGYSKDVDTLGLRPVSVAMHRLKSDPLSNNQSDDNNDEADVNDLAESIVNTTNVKTETIQSRPFIDPDSEQNTVMIFSSDSDEDEDRSEVALIEVPEMEQEQAPIDNNSQSSTSDRSDDPIPNNTTVRLLSLSENKKRAQSSKNNEQTEKPANNNMPNLSMPIIDETAAIASKSGLTPLNGSSSNTVATNTVIDDDEDWREIKLLVRKKMKKDHRLEQQHYQETMIAAKTKIKKLEERIKVVEKENEHWKIKIREDAADFKKKLGEKDETIKNQSEEKEDAVKRLEIEYAAKLEAMKVELNEQWRHKKWCTLCGKEIEAESFDTGFCSFQCMRQSWLQNANNVLIQTNNNEAEFNMDELDE